MQNKRLFILLPIFLGFSLLLALMLWHGNSEVVPSPMTGKEAPVFSLPQLEDATKTFSNTDLTAHPVAVVNVWASWCVPCRAEMRLLQELRQSHPQVPIFGIVYKDTREAAQKLLAQVNPFTASGMDDKAFTSIDWGVYGVPETFVVQTRNNAEGKPTAYIVDKHIGVLTPEHMRFKLIPLLQTLTAENSARVEP